MLAELDNLPELFESLMHQSFSDFTVYCCVNNPEGWAQSGNDIEQAMYRNNQASLTHLYHLAEKMHQGPPALHIIDRSSPGKGWEPKRRGVGWARKTLMESIAKHHDDDTLIVSLDADTAISTTYLASVADRMNTHPSHNALCVPYYHPLSGDADQDRAMLRYEVYMRHYLLSLLESGNPYAFTALGSAMVFPLWAYRRVGGYTPLQGGEDFYLMQKFAKTGKMLLDCSEPVRPQGRPSMRVPFGTGPAIAKGIDSLSAAYPLFPAEGFQAVADTYATFPNLYDHDIETPMTPFLQQQLRTDDLWQPLRNNFKTRELFVHACHERVDGLRILQFLKTFNLRPAEEELRQWGARHQLPIKKDLNFATSPIAEINNLRNSIFELEAQLRRHCDNSRRNNL